MPRSALIGSNTARLSVSAKIFTLNACVVQMMRPETRRGHRAMKIFSFRSRGHYGFSRHLVIWGYSIAHETIQLTCTVVTGSQLNFGGHKLRPRS